MSSLRWSMHCRRKIVHIFELTNPASQYILVETRGSLDPFSKKVSESSQKYNMRPLTCTFVVLDGEASHISQQSNSGCQSDITWTHTWVRYIINATWWVLMSTRFRTCMAKGVRESARPSYGCWKLTLISRERKNMFSGVRQNYLATKFNTRAKSSSEGVRSVYKKILSRGFCSKIKILAK